jgi:hypothetical protein
MFYFVFLQRLLIIFNEKMHLYMKNSNRHSFTLAKSSNLASLMIGKWVGTYGPPAVMQWGIKNITSMVFLPPKV